MTPGPQPMRQGPQPLDLLLALPAELRNEIYSHLLPYPLPEIIIRARYARLRWLVAARSLFNDVAPSLYSNATFVIYLKLDPAVDDLGTVGNSFRDHLRPTYGPDLPDWVMPDACNLVRRISVDVIAPVLTPLLQPIHGRSPGAENMGLAISRYFASVSQSFPSLQSIRICFQDESTHQDLSNTLRAALTQAQVDLWRTLANDWEVEVL